MQLDRRYLLKSVLCVFLSESSSTPLAQTYPGNVAGGPGDGSPASPRIALLPIQSGGDARPRWKLLLDPGSMAEAVPYSWKVARYSSRGEAAGPVAAANAVLRPNETETIISPIVNDDGHDPRIYSMVASLAGGKQVRSDWFPVNDRVSADVDTVRNIGGVLYAIVDQPLRMKNYAPGDEVIWTRDGLVVSTGPTYVVGADDVRADKTLCWVRGYLRKKGSAAFSTHDKPIRPILYSTVMGVKDGEGRRVGSDGRPMLRPRPRTVNRENGYKLSRPAQLFFVDGVSGDGRFDGRSPWPGFDCIINYDAAGFCEIRRGAANASAGPKSTIGDGAALVNDGMSAATMDGKFGDWCLVADGCDYQDGPGNLRFKGGYSPAYPTVFATYRRSDPTDHEQWGRVPVRFGAGGPPDLSASQGGDYVKNFVFMGFRYLNRGLRNKITFSAGPDHTLFFNMQFIGAELNFSEDTVVGRNDDPFVTFVHCSFGHSYNGSPQDSQSRAQGLFMNGRRHGTSRRSVYGCVFYMNGWDGDRDSDATGANFYSHNWYMSEHMDAVEVRHTISAEAAFSGANQRCGGWLTDCAFIRNPVLSFGGYVSGSSAAPPVQVAVQNCLVLSANEASSPGRPKRGSAFQTITTKNGGPSSFVRYNLVATGSAASESNPIMVWAPNGQPSFCDVVGNTQRTNGGPVTLNTAAEGDPSLVTRSDRDNIYSHGEGLSGRDERSFTLTMPGGSNVDSATVRFPKRPSTEEQWAKAEGFGSFADLMDHAVLNPLEHWSLRAIGYCVPTSVPPRDDPRLFPPGRVKGAVTPAGYWNDGSVLDGRGYPTGMMPSA